MRNQGTERELRLQIDDMRLVYPRLKDHELFLVWFLHAMVTEDLAKAAAALTGNAKDKGADAILIDDRTKVVFIIQGKYHGKINGAAEHRADVISFTNLAQNLFGSDDDYRGLVKDTDPRVHERLKEVRDRLRRRTYDLKLYYVTTGRCSKQLVEQAERACRRAGGPTELEVFDGNRTLHALSDYLDGVAPPVPTMDLPARLGRDASDLHGTLSRLASRTSASGST